ncbi:MAG: contractile injection system tape measure protein [Bacteroidota bacterium]
MLTHLIHKQTVELEVSSVSRAMEVQDRFRQTYYEKLIPRMEEVFTSHSHEGLTYRLEKLEVDLGSLPGEAFEENLWERFVEVLTESLRNQLDEEILFSVSQEEKVLPISQQARHTDLLIYFLENGFLPWWAAHEPMQKLEKVLKEILDSGGEGKRLFFQKLLQLPAQKVAKRINRQFSHILSATVYQRLLHHSSGNIQAWAALLDSVQAEDKQNVGLKKKIRSRVLLPWLLLVRQKSMAAGTAATLFVELFRKEIANTSIQEVLSSNVLRNIQRVTKPSFLSYSASQLDFMKTLYKVLFSHEEVNKAKLPLVEASQKQVRISKKEEVVAGQKENDPVEEEVIKPFLAEEGIFIQNAGLVLISPFFGSYLGKLGLLEKGKFKDEAAHERALLLSQYLVTAEHSFPEPEILLNKVLCGWPIQKPAPKEFYPTDKESQEARELLSSVISHWEVIKNTSIENFQQFFLQREGKLSIHPDQYFLKVQRDGADILLEKLPWNISFQRFTWMDRPLIAEW